MVQSLTFAKTAMLRSLNRPCAASSAGRLRQQRNRFSVVAAASPDKKDDKDLRLSRMLSVNMSKEDRAKLSEGLKRLGVKDASDLRKALLKQEAVVALRIALDAGINTLGAVFSAESFDDFAHAPPGVLPEWARWGLVAISAFASGWFAVAVVGDVVLLLITLVASASAGISADSFLALALPDKSDAAPLLEPRKNPADGAKNVLAALQASSALGDIMAKLKAASQSVDGASNDSSTTTRTLSSFFKLQAAEAAGFNPASVGMTEAEAMVVARAFDEADENDDGQLDASELRHLIAKLSDSPAAAAAAAAALSAADEQPLTLPVFAQWWAGAPASKAPAAKEPAGSAR